MREKVHEIVFSPQFKTEYLDSLTHRFRSCQIHADEPEHGLKEESKNKGYINLVAKAGGYDLEEKMLTMKKFDEGKFDGKAAQKLV